MRRILFYYDNYCGEQSHGGTEVATNRIAKALKATGACEIYHAYLHKGDYTTDSAYNGQIKAKKSTMVKELADYIAGNEIDTIVNMGRFFRHYKLKEAIQKSGRDVKLFFMHHFAPGSEKKKPTFTSGRHLLALDPLNPLYWIRATIYPLIKLPRTLRWRSIYKEVYDISDSIILLAMGYAKEYMRAAGIRNDEGNKFHAIPNIYDAPRQATLPNKEKRVLILSRMDEIQKRITLALKIWKEIEADERLKDWKMDIVGTGHDMRGIRKAAKRMGLKRVTFHGWKRSKPFLEKSSILMTTSDYEGLSLAMIEAQAYGCIPIAFNSYASLKEVIENGETGIIVETPGDIDEYTKSLTRAMLDEKGRTIMAAKAKEGSNRFSSKKIAERWLEIL